jgi:hypothetical protein
MSNASSVHDHLARLDRPIAGAGLAAAELRRAAGLRASGGRHGFAARHYRHEAEALLRELRDERRRWLESTGGRSMAPLRLVA